MMLLEASAAATFFAVAMMFYMTIMNKQFELSRRARDLDLIEAAVNQDINAFRHQARLWYLWRGPYSATFNDSVYTASPNVITYAPLDDVCYAWGAGKKGYFEKNSFSDNYRYLKVPGAIDISQRSTSIGSVSGYNIQRLVSFPSAPTTSVNGDSAANNYIAQTLRVTYIVTIPGTPPKRAFSFERTADIQIPAGTFC